MEIPDGSNDFSNEGVKTLVEEEEEIVENGSSDLFLDGRGSQNGKSSGSPLKSAEVLWKSRDSEKEGEEDDVFSSGLLPSAVNSGKSLVCGDDAVENVALGLILASGIGSPPSSPADNEAAVTAPSEVAPSVKAAMLSVSHTPAFAFPLDHVAPHAPSRSLNRPLSLLPTNSLSGAHVIALDPCANSSPQPSRKPAHLPPLSLLRGPSNFLDGDELQPHGNPMDLLRSDFFGDSKLLTGSMISLLRLGLTVSFGCPTMFTSEIQRNADYGGCWWWRGAAMTKVEVTKRWSWWCRRRRQEVAWRRRRV